MAYQPRYQFDPSAGGEPALGQAAPLPLEYTVSPEHVLYYSAYGRVLYEPTNRSLFRLDYGFRDMSSRSQGSFLGKTQDGGGLYRRGLRPSRALRLPVII